MSEFSLISTECIKCGKSISIYQGDELICQECGGEGVIQNDE